MEGDWNTLKTCLLKNAGVEDVCGVTKGPPKRKNPWWWNDEVGKAVKKKGIAFRSWKKAKQGLDRKLEDELKVSYCQIKSEMRKVIYRAL